MKKSTILTAAFILSIIVSISCSEGLSSVIQTSIYQVPGCKKNSLFKTGTTYIDSCFTYSFTEKLIIDFCVGGNCCPDSHRYSITSKVLSDSIIISVIDTAQNKCKCICNYIIHGEFESLQKDEYFVKCILNEHPVYLKIVKRKNTGRSW